MMNATNASTDNQRLSGETAAAYAAYCSYRDLGASRSLAAAWQAYRQTAKRRKFSRGRPRLKNAKATCPSGQWTAWSKKYQWAERAASHDAWLQQERQEKLHASLWELEQRQEQWELTVQEERERQVWKLEEILDEADRMPVTTITRWERETMGRKVLRAQKTHVDGVNFSGYARLVHEANATAHKAMNGLDQLVTPERCFYTDHSRVAEPSNSPESGLSACGTGTGPERLPGESARAYRAYCVYRDQGPQRSLATAWRAAHPEMMSADRSQPASEQRRSAGHWPKWSAQWRWAERARAHDAKVETTKRAAAQQREDLLRDRRLRFMIANQDRIEQRLRKMRARGATADKALASDITIIKTEGSGTYIRKTKTLIQGLNWSGFASFHIELRALGRLAMGHMYGRPNAPVPPIPTLTPDLVITIPGN